MSKNLDGNLDGNLDDTANIPANIPAISTELLTGAETSVIANVTDTIPLGELSKILENKVNMQELGPLIANVIKNVPPELREDINKLFEAKTAENKDFKTALEALQSNLIEIYNSSEEKKPASGSGGGKRRRTKKRKHYKKRRSTKHR